MSDAAAGGADESTWAVQFPGNLRWSNAMQIVKGMVPWAAVSMDEIDRIMAEIASIVAKKDYDRSAVTSVVT